MENERYVIGKDFNTKDWFVYDNEINSRIEEVANREDITSEEYCQIYEDAMLVYKVKFGIM